MTQHREDSMSQKMPRNELLHERRHKRKAGAHGPAGPTVPSEREAIREALREGFCVCSFTERMLGDGCINCNPACMDDYEGEER
jgi:hypothetical protein